MYIIVIFLMFFVQYFVFLSGDRLCADGYLEQPEMRSNAYNDLPYNETESE